MEKASTVGLHLIQAIKNLGVQTVYGIPGDLIIKFFKLLEEDPTINLCTLSHEPAVGFAAIGAARATQKPAVACVTYGPGALSLVNTVACAYSEKVPLIVIAGGPPKSVRDSGFLVHHTIKGWDTQLKVYSQVTAETVLLDAPQTAASKIAGALAVCMERMLPVYIEMPSDMVETEIADTPQTEKSGLINEKASSEAATVVLSKIQEAAKPVFMFGVEAVRYGLVDEISAVARKLNIPVVSTMLARDYMPLQAENYFGVYLGEAGSVDAKTLVDESDLVLMLGEDVSDVNFGMELAQERTGQIIRCTSSELKTADHLYSGVSLSALVSMLSHTKPKGKWHARPSRAQSIQQIEPDSTMTTDALIRIINKFFYKYGEMPVISDTGEFLFATLQLEASSIIGSSFYGTMGFAVPAAIGYAIESKKRPLVLVGDGAFQMTGQEICHCPKYDINPIFIVSNNRVWGMEQLFHPSSINNLVNWPYAGMAQLWGGKSYMCRTSDEFWEALKNAKDQKVFSLIEVATVGSERLGPLFTYVSEQKKETGNPTKDSKETVPIPSDG